MRLKGGKFARHLRVGSISNQAKGWFSVKKKILRVTVIASLLASLLAAAAFGSTVFVEESRLSFAVRLFRVLAEANLENASEELLNYFPSVSGDMKPNRLVDSPFRAAYELAPCPWNDNNVLLWFSVDADDADYATSPPANLVFLVDVSGSMDSPERLPLTQSSLKTLAGKLRGEDKISIVTYAGTTQVALESTAGSEKARILSAIDKLTAGGSTAGGAGIKLTYEQAGRG
jgi:hypothetical protein